MKNTITRVDALNTAINTLSNVEAYGDEAIQNNAIVEILTKIRDQIAKPRTTSDEAKTKANEKRKAATAAARAEMCAQVVPILRKYLTTPITAKELYEVAKAELPADFSWNKVQNVLIREMAPELTKVEAKGKANTYCVKAD